MRRLGQTWPEAIKASNVLQSLKSEFYIAPATIAATTSQPVQATDADLDGLHEWLSGQDFLGTFFPDQPQWEWDVNGGVGNGLFQ